MVSGPTPKVHPLRRRKALLIGPSPKANTHLAAFFEDQVWEVNYAEGNESALRMAREEVFDLILTGMETSCAEDVEMLRRLRVVRPHTRVIILTEQWVPGDILKAMRNHAFSYFRLPLAEADLRDLIEQAVEEPVWDDGIEVIQGTMQHVVLAVRCDLKTLDRLVQFLRESLFFLPQESEDVAFAFREVVMNAMEHGGRFDPQKFVEIAYLRSKRMVMCRVKDPGEGFSLDEICVAEAAGPLVECAELTRGAGDVEVPAGGLGILIAQKFVDELIFSEKGNEAFLIKYLPPEQWPLGGAG